MIHRIQAGRMHRVELLLEDRMWGGNMKVFMINNDGYDSNILWSSEWCFQVFMEEIKKGFLDIF